MASENPQQPESTTPSGIFSDCINNFLGIFVDPITCIEYAYNRTSQAAGFVFLGINLLLIFILSSLLMYNYDYAIKNNFLCGFELTLLMATIKLLITASSFFTKDVKGSFLNALGAFGIITIPTSLLMIVMILPAALNVSGTNTIIRVTWASLDMLYGYFAFTTMHKNNKSQNIGIYVLTQFIVCVIYGIFNYYI